MSNFEQHRASLLKDVHYIDAKSYDHVANKVYRFQSQYNSVYRRWSALNDRHQYPDGAYPFLPISAYKNHRVKTGKWQEEIVFYSSGTTGQQSRHYIRDYDRYCSWSSANFIKSLSLRSSSRLYALLPSYHEQQESSLLHMVRAISEKVDFQGYWTSDYRELARLVERDIRQGLDVVLFGVSYALLDLAWSRQIEGSYKLVYTGGMKGRKREMIADELEAEFKKSFAQAMIYSEYGMTELNSQAYKSPENPFYSPPTSVKMYVASLDDPYSISDSGRGLACVIDLANIDSCSFIRTEDIIELTPEGDFRVLGRSDGSEQRGCNQMYLNV